MEYFLSHILYILGGGLILGIIACLGVFLTYKNGNENKGCGYGCSSCKSKCAVADEQRIKQQNK